VCESTVPLESNATKVLFKPTKREKRLAEQLKEASKEGEEKDEDGVEALASHA